MSAFNDITSSTFHFVVVTALGTNAGLVYWYDRENNVLERQWCPDRSTPIAKVALIESVEYMLAAGNVDGGITIFQVSTRKESLHFLSHIVTLCPLSFLKIPLGVDPSIFPIPRISEESKPEVSLFHIQNCHRRQISALEWSKNGMKLFSGDQEGKVTSTKRIAANSNFNLSHFFLLFRFLFTSWMFSASRLVPRNCSRNAIPALSGSTT